MIDKKISVSEQVANLSAEAQVVFTWSVPHSDDIGLLPRSHRTLKAMIVPMWDCNLEKFDTYIKEIVEQKLWFEMKYKEQTFYILARFQDHQTLKKDRQPQTLLDAPTYKEPKESWQTLATILADSGIQVEDSVFQMESEVKRSEVKRSEVKRNSATTKKVEENFETFWSVYPNKTAKKKAHYIWLKIAPTGKLFKQIMAGLKRAKASSQWLKDGGQFIPHPTTWLNQERWNDEGAAGIGRKTDVL